MTNFIAARCQQLERVWLKLDELTDFEFMHDPAFLPSCWTWRAVGGTLFILVVMQEAGNLSSQHGRLLHVAQ